MGILNKKIFSRCENTCVKMKRKKKKNLLCFVYRASYNLHKTDHLIFEKY